MILATLVGAFLSLFADTTSTSTDALPSMATLIVQLGLSCVFLWQWQSERKERAQAQEQLRQFLEKFAPILSDAIDVLKEVKTGLLQMFERVTPDRGEYDAALRRLEHVTDEINHMLREAGHHD